MALIEYSSATLVHPASNMNKHALIDFFYFCGTDDKGRTLDFILNQPDEWLESTHDYIQWLFPLKERSGANPNAPLFDNELLGAFRLYSVGRDQMVRALDRMLKFYGLQRDDLVISKASIWNERKGYWYVEPTHNDLRISRIIKSMSILTMVEHSESILDTLHILAGESDCGFSREAIEFWNSAIDRSSKMKMPWKSKQVSMSNAEFVASPFYDQMIAQIHQFEAWRQAEERVKEYFAKHLQ
jgi:hypothetical protein